jgi:hypothetical protein
MVLSKIDALHVTQQSPKADDSGSNYCENFKNVSNNAGISSAAAKLIGFFNQYFSEAFLI